MKLVMSYIFWLRTETMLRNKIFFYSLVTYYFCESWVMQIDTNTCRLQKTKVSIVGKKIFQICIPWRLLKQNKINKSNSWDISLDILACYAWGHYFLFGSAPNPEPSPGCWTLFRLSLIWKSVWKCDRCLAAHWQYKGLSDRATWKVRELQS